MGGFPVVPRESRMRMGPYPPGVIAIWDSWRANLNNLHGPLVKISEPVTYQGELQCDRGPGAVRVFHVAGLHCRHLDLHSAVLWEQLLPGQDPNAAVDPLVFRSGAVQRWGPVLNLGIPRPGRRAPSPESISVSPEREWSGFQSPERFQATTRSSTS